MSATSEMSSSAVIPISKRSRFGLSSVGRVLIGMEFAVSLDAVSCPQCGHGRIRAQSKEGGGWTYTCLTCHYQWAKA
jgi:transposase-like protein